MNEHRSFSIAVEESALLQKINKDFPQQTRYRELIHKRIAETLTEAEYDELLELTHQAEAHDVLRLEVLSQLSELRETSLSAVMEQLELKPIQLV